MKYNVLFFVVLIALVFSCEKEEIATPTAYIKSYDVTADLSLQQILEDLNGIEHIGSLRLVDNDEIIDLNPFIFLKKVDELILSNCANISSLEGIESLKVTERLSISDCAALTAIESLDGVKKLQILAIDNCMGLKSIRFNELEEVEQLNYQFLPRLEKIELPKLQTTKQELRINNCDQLTVLQLNQLTTASGMLSLQGLNRIDAFNDFINLRAVEHLLIGSNMNLESIAGFTHLEQAEKIEVWGNPIVDFCPLKTAVLNSPNILFDIQGLNIPSVDQAYFEDCE